MTLDVDAALDIASFDHVASQVVSRHRWYTKRLVVFEADGGLRGFHYLEPASEEQEDQDRFDAVPVPTFSVVAREVVSTVYEAAA